MINSSVLRHSSQPYGAYKMSKHALLALARSLATELGPQGIRVNSVAPGYIWADTLQNYFAYLARKRGVDAQVIYDETAANMDLRRLPEPDQIADAVVFMASRHGAGHHRALPRRQLRRVPPLMTSSTRAGRADIGTVDDLHASATKITGLDDFGGEDYLAGLQVLLASYAQDEKLTPLGKQGAPRRAARRAGGAPAQRGGVAAVPAARGRVDHPPRLRHRAAAHRHDGAAPAAVRGPGAPGSGDCG